jgi:hypothetical protein
MQRLEVSCAVRPIYGSLGVKGLKFMSHGFWGQRWTSAVRSTAFEAGLEFELLSVLFLSSRLNLASACNVWGWICIWAVQCTVCEAYDELYLSVHPLRPEMNFGCSVHRVWGRIWIWTIQRTVFEPETEPGLIVQVFRLLMTFGCPVYFFWSGRLTRCSVRFSGVAVRILSCRIVFCVIEEPGVYRFLVRASCFTFVCYK